MGSVSFYLENSSFRKKIATFAGAALLCLFAAEPACAQPAATPTPRPATVADLTKSPRGNVKATTATSVGATDDKPIAPRTIYNPVISDRVWLAPFFYLAVVLGVYLYSPQEKRAEVQERMKKELNFYLGGGVALSFLAVIGVWLNSTTTVPGTHWFRWIVWLAALALIAVGVRKALVPPPPEEQYESPL